MLDLGIVRPGSTVRIPFNTFDKDDGSSVTATNYAAADILIYKDGNTTSRASAAGITATTDFNTKAGEHLAIIDLADNTTADFYAAGSEYLVALDSITVDGVTVRAWIGRFRIGYPGALLDTTIATLASQTSFTLTNGPAEDDALNELLVLVHDAASAVQMAWVEVLDYTGSTKTVTLAAAPTFTIAAKDNVSFLLPAGLRPTTTGRKIGVDANNRIDVGLWLGAAPAALTTNGYLQVALLRWLTDNAAGTPDALSSNKLPADVKLWLASAPDALSSGKLPADVKLWLASAPNALISGRLDANVQAMAAGVILAATFAANAIDNVALASSAANEIRDAIFARLFGAGMSNKSFEEIVQAIFAMVGGPTAGAGTTTETFKLPDGTTAVTVTNDGTNRTASTIA
jgi:hypothetical protein